MLDLIVAGYWGPRREPAAQCAKRLGGFLKSLSKQDELFSRWYLVQHGRKERQELDYKRQNSVLKVVEKVGPVQDDAGKLIPEWGFSMLLWNGENLPREASLSTLSGHYCDGYAPNVCLLYPPEGMPGMTDSDKMVRILWTVAKYYEPDWGGVISTDSRNARNLEPGELYADWIFYASRKLFPLESIPEKFQSQSVGRLGKIIVVQPTPCDARKPAHLARIRSLEKALGIDRMNQLQKEELAKFRAEAMERMERQRKLAPEDEFVPPPAPVT